MIFSILIIILICLIQHSLIKGKIKQISLLKWYGIIMIILIGVGFLYQESLLILAIVFICFVLWRYRVVKAKQISYLMCITLILTAFYCHFFNGLIFMKGEDYFKIYSKAHYHHEFFPIRIISSKDETIIKSVELGIRWKEKAFQETVWLDGNELIYAHDNRGFGESNLIQYKYGTKIPYNYP